jgi:hypothetical protein
MAADVRGGTVNRKWLRSSRCTPTKNCVEIGATDTGVIIRDSKSGTTLRAVGAVPWAAFLAHCRAIRRPVIKRERAIWHVHA